MLAYGVDIKILLNWVKVEVIAKIQHYISSRTTPLHEKQNYKDYCQYLCYHFFNFSTVSVHDVQKKYIDEIICHIFHYYIKT